MCYTNPQGLCLKMAERSRFSPPFWGNRLNIEAAHGPSLRLVQGKGRTATLMYSTTHGLFSLHPAPNPGIIVGRFGTFDVLFLQHLHQSGVLVTRLVAGIGK